MTAPYFATPADPTSSDVLLILPGADSSGADIVLRLGEEEQYAFARAWQDIAILRPILRGHLEAPDGSADPAKHPTVEEAIRIVGSQGRLARAIGASQSTISRMLLREIPIAAEAAVGIERATDGRIGRWQLRPDLWDPPAHGRSIHPTDTPTRPSHAGAAR